MRERSCVWGEGGAPAADLGVTLALADDVAEEAEAALVFEKRRCETDSDGIADERRTEGFVTVPTPPIREGGGGMNRDESE